MWTDKFGVVNTWFVGDIVSIGENIWTFRWIYDKKRVVDMSDVARYGRYGPSLVESR